MPSNRRADTEKTQPFQTQSVQQLSLRLGADKTVAFNAFGQLNHHHHIVTMNHFVVRHVAQDVGDLVNADRALFVDVLLRIS